MLKATVSGSFHRHMTVITDAVNALHEAGVKVLSPADPRIVDAQGEFLFVASDRMRSIRLVQDRHLDAIRSADFLWLVCPDGYVGQSASMEIGFAAGAGVPVLSTTAPADITLREYVSIVPSLKAAILQASSFNSSRNSEGILIDPHASVELAHQRLDSLASMLARKIRKNDEVRAVFSGLSDIRTALCIPTVIN